MTDVDSVIARIDEITGPEHMTPVQALAFMERLYRAVDVRVAALRGTVEKQ